MAHGMILPRQAGTTDTRPPVHEWRLHVGAHKTATTHIQQTLDAIRSQLVQGGTDAIPVDLFRPVWKAQTLRFGRYRRMHRAALLRGWPVPTADLDRFARDLDGLRAGPGRILISEENLPGETDAAVGAGPYPDLVPRLRLLRALLEGVSRRAGHRDPAIHLLLCIRDMGSFLPSVYAEALKFFPVPRPFETAMGAALQTPPRWCDVVQGIRKAMPRARLTVWRYEDYQANSRDILALLAGTDPGPLPDLPRPTQTMTPSAAAVRAVEAMADLDMLPFHARIARVREAYSAAPANPDHPAFRPLSDAQLARCTRAYEADCAQLDSAGLLQRFAPS